MEGKLRIKRVPFSNFLLWLQSVQIPPHKFSAAKVVKKIILAIPRVAYLCPPIEYI